MQNYFNQQHNYTFMIRINWLWVRVGYFLTQGPFIQCKPKIF